MKIEQSLWTQAKGWGSGSPGKLGESAQLVLVFGCRWVLGEKALLGQVKKAYPNAKFLGCSTSGEICGTLVTDDSLVVTAVRFDHPQVEGAKVKIKEGEGSFQIGEKLAQSLPKEDLRHVFVILEGLKVNASDLVAGLTKHLPPRVEVMRRSNRRPTAFWWSTRRGKTPASIRSSSKCGISRPTSFPIEPRTIA